MCTPTETSIPNRPWHGVCTNTPSPPPSQINCIMNGTPTCPSPSFCTPTETSTSGKAWHGTCITTSPPYTIPCIMSSTLTCPSPLQCTPTESSTMSKPWHGVCFTTAPPGPTSACLVSNPVTKCSKAMETCKPFAASCTSSNCLGTCVSAPTPTPPVKSCTCEEECAWGERCARKPGANCGVPSRHCPGVCREGWGY